MDFEARPVGGADHLRGAVGANRPRPAAARAAGALPAVRVTLTQGPPPEASADVARAAERCEQLREQGRELRFQLDHESGRVRVEVRDLNGQLLRTIPLKEALDVAGGLPLD